MESIETYKSPLANGTANGLEEVFAEMRKDAKKRRRAKTPKEATKTLSGKGGKSFKYVNGSYAQQWLDDNYPGSSWQVEPSSVFQIGNFVHVAGTLTFVEKSGLIRKITRYGGKEAIQSNGSLVTHPYLKSAETDALKRCLAFLGMASDIYGEDYGEEQAICDIEDIRWFASQMPYLLATLPPEKLFNIPIQFNALYNTQITKQKLIDNYAKLGIELAE